MVEIVGKDVSVAKECTCKGCGAILKYYENDVKRIVTAYYIACPECSKPVFVKGF